MDLRARREYFLPVELMMENAGLQLQLYKEKETYHQDQTKTLIFITNE